MSNFLKVAQRGSIMSCTGHRKRVMGGTRLDRDECMALFGGAKEVDRLVAQGYLIELGVEYDPENPPLPPQIDTQKPHPAEVDMNKGEKPMETASRTSPVSVRAPKAEPVEMVMSQWMLDPTTLTDKDVTELNIMISERTPEGQKIRKFETKEEAAAWLSKDFEDSKVATG